MTTNAGPDPSQPLPKSDPGSEDINFEEVLNSLINNPEELMRFSQEFQEDDIPSPLSSEASVIPETPPSLPLTDVPMLVFVSKDNPADEQPAAAPGEAKDELPPAPVIVANSDDHKHEQPVAAPGEVAEEEDNEIVIQIRSDPTKAVTFTAPSMTKNNNKKRNRNNLAINANFSITTPAGDPVSNYDREAKRQANSNIEKGFTQKRF